MSRSSPIHRLPPRALRQIFSSFRGPTYLLNPSLLHPEEPVDIGMTPTISLVCSHWREIVLSSPNLWSWIVFGYHENMRHETQGEGLHRRASKMLARADNLPLKIEIVCWVESKSYPSFLGPALEEICRTSGRWAELHFRGSSFWFFRHPIVRVAKLRSLNRLSLHFAEDSDEDPIPSQIPELFTDCPALRSISLGPYIFPEEPLPWQHIRNMTLEVHSHPQSQLSLLPCLSKCSNLDSLVLYLYDPDLTFGGVENVSTNIRSLSLFVDENFGSSPSLFRQVAFPRLSTLHIAPLKLEDRYWRNATPLINLLTASQPPITSLYLTRLSLPSKQCLEVLKVMPRLETLHITEHNGPRYPDSRHNITCTWELFDGLVIHLENDHPLLPKLRHLSITIHRHGLDLDALYDAVSSRCPRGGGGGGGGEVHDESYEYLRSLEINFHYKHEPGGFLGQRVSIGRSLERLESLRDVGLEVSVWVPL
ncbi:hypothetical protein L218DRAFT_1079900 [Marasmius fiardii PR-910]|nr:hypothetical protein L218DRAFT_1079900 [Marasmius fiardii PR-910]